MVCFLLSLLRLTWNGLPRTTGYSITWKKSLKVGFGNVHVGHAFLITADPTPAPALAAARRRLETIRNADDYRDHVVARNAPTGRRAGQTVGLVPTMGAFHEGHLTLMRRAKAENDVVIVTLFVNPTQFNDLDDFDRYPRDLERDAQMAEAEGVDVLVHADPDEMYPKGFDTVVVVRALSERLEGASRPGHFQGVATVVTKLLNVAGADRAYFGEKDWQQLQVIRALARDLDIPTEIVGVPIVREADGLALSSRNVRLTPEQRAAALVLSQAWTMPRPSPTRACRTPINSRPGCGRPLRCSRSPAWITPSSWIRRRFRR